MGEWAEVLKWATDAGGGPLVALIVTAVLVQRGVLGVKSTATEVVAAGGYAQIIEQLRGEVARLSRRLEEREIECARRIDELEREVDDLREVLRKRFPA